jgi:hypothetical protein
MKKLLALAAMLALLTVALPAGVASAATCTATGFAGLTAAEVNPASVTGEVDATGCNIGVYYDSGTGSIDGADIHGANYYGVVVNGDANNVSVDITDSSIHDIGESPFNGSQHGNAIYYRALDVGTATGTVDGNTVSRYQKNGITVNGAGATVAVTNNTVTGQGQIDYIAQNGVQFGYGAKGSVIGNTITDDWYTACSNQDAAKTGCTPWVSAGLLLYDVDTNALKISNNTFRNDQRNQYLLTSASLSPGP